MLLGVLFLSGLVLVCLPGLLSRFARRLEPSEWADMCRIALLTGAAVVEVSLIGQAAPTVLRFFGVTRLAEACEKMVGTWVPGGPVAGWASAGLALALPMLAILGVWRTRRTWQRVHIEAGLGRRDRFAGTEVAVLPTTKAVAYSVHFGGRDQIVVSDGLLDGLTGEQADAVMRHEAAHLSLRHHRFLLAGAAAEYAFARIAPVRASVAAMRVGLERWADEEACGTSTSRRHHLADALLGVAQVGVIETVNALWGNSIIGDRVVALEDEPHRSGVARRLVAYVPFVVVSLLGAAALGTWLGEMPAVVSMATCPLS